MKRAKETLRKSRAVFLAIFVAVQIFVPQAAVQAATCNHNYVGMYVKTDKYSEGKHELYNKQTGQMEECYTVTYLRVYQNKCTKCGNVSGNGYTSFYTTHSHPNCN